MTVILIISHKGETETGAKASVFPYQAVARQRHAACTFPFSKLNGLLFMKHEAHLKSVVYRSTNLSID